MLKNQFEEIRDTLYKFLETRINLLEVETRGYIEKIILKIIYASFVLMTAVIVTVFLLILLAIYLNSLIESVYAGYLIVAGLFTIILVVLVTMRPMVMKFIRWVLEQTFEKE